jgi:hypothetical protein
VLGAVGSGLAIVPEFTVFFDGLLVSFTTGKLRFAECPEHSAKIEKRSAKPLPSVALGKEHPVKNLSAKSSLPSALFRTLGKDLAERLFRTRQRPV